MFREGRAAVAMGWRGFVTTYYDVVADGLTFSQFIGDDRMMDAVAGFAPGSGTIMSGTEAYNLCFDPN